MNDKPRTGVFGPNFQRALALLNAKKLDAEREIANLLAAYADGAGLPPGQFDWNEQGEWTHTPQDAPVSFLPKPAPQKGPKGQAG